LDEPTATEDVAVTEAPSEGPPKKRPTRRRRAPAQKATSEESPQAESPAGAAAPGPEPPQVEERTTEEPSPAPEALAEGGEPSAAPRRSRRRRPRKSAADTPRPEGAEAPAVALPESTEGETGETMPKPLVAVAAAEEARPGSTVSEGSGSGRQSTGRRKRKGSRRPRMEHIAPLGPRKMLVTVGEERSQIAVLEGRELIEHYVAKREDVSIVGNIYVGRVENVLPGMEAAFLDIGEARNAVLYVGEVSHEEELDGPSPRIETLLKSGQAVVAQVTKDPMGSKGARLTTEVSIAGRYLVLVPNADSLGISRRLADNERRRLRDIGSRIRPEGHGLIVRTAAIGVTEEDLERDASRLIRIWNEVLEKSKNAKPPKLVYSEPPLAIRVIRDLFTTDVEQVLADDELVYKEIREYLEEMAPDLAGRVELYQDPLRLFERYHVTEQVRKAVDRKVWLASGGHIVIDRTEAMTVIDVNTGRFVGRSTLEDTVLHANLEAAEEIAKQLRLRDIGGIIVIDFIDMGYERNREELLRVFENALLRDKTRTQVYGVSDLGLVQMTRKRISEGLLEAFSHKCEECDGRGLILHAFD